jgi:hypothetical protein
MRNRIQHFALMRIRIQLPKMIRIHADSDPDPQPCPKSSSCLFSLPPAEAQILTRLLASITKSSILLMSRKCFQSFTTHSQVIHYYPYSFCIPSIIGWPFRFSKAPKRLINFFLVLVLWCPKVQFINKSLMPDFLLSLLEGWVQKGWIIDWKLVTYW